MADPIQSPLRNAVSRTIKVQCIASVYIHVTCHTVPKIPASTVNAPKRMAAL